MRCRIAQVVHLPTRRSAEPIETNKAKQTHVSGRGVASTPSEGQHRHRTLAGAVPCSAAQPGDLVLAEPGHAEPLDQAVHPRGGHPIDVGLLDDGDQGLLSPPARLQNDGKYEPCRSRGMASSIWPTRVSQAAARPGQLGLWQRRQSCEPASRSSMDALSDDTGRQSIVVTGLRSLFRTQWQTSGDDPKTSVMLMRRMDRCSRQEVLQH
jgi:hypothetical protein